MARAKYDFVAWKNDGIWTVHCPSIVGVYGTGKTLAEAKEDFVSAATDMLDYRRSIGEPDPRPAHVRVGEVSF